MWTFVKHHPARILAVVLVAAATVYPAFATKGAPMPAEPAYRLRCWQYGRLIFDESGLGAPGSSAAIALSLRGPGPKAPMHLVETENATCLMTRAQSAGLPHP